VAAVVDVCMCSASVIASGQSAQILGSVRTAAQRAFRAPAVAEWWRYVRRAVGHLLAHSVTTEGSAPEGFHRWQLPTSGGG
jgi:hypothetical protein